MGRILLVEDDRDTRELISELANLDGHESVSCATAEQVGSQLADGPAPDLAIIDINLPDEHGVSLAWRLRKGSPGLPIMIVSAVIEQWERDDLRDCGIDFMLEKPFRLEDLRQAIDHFIKHGRQARPAWPAPRQLPEQPWHLEGETLICLECELQLSLAEAFAAQLDDLTGRRNRALKIDLSRCQTVSSVYLGLLASAALRARHHSSLLEVVISPRLGRVFAKSRLSESLKLTIGPDK